MKASIFDKGNMVNLWIFVSETQRKSITKTESIKSKNIFVSRNSFDDKIYTKKLATTKKKTGQVIYCSIPDRGLETLIKIWPKIRRSVPKAKLIVTSGFTLWGYSQTDNDQICKKIYDQARKTKGIVLLKAIPKKQLANIQAESTLFLYPTNFNEMFCISALECMRVGTPLVCSHRAALIERVKDGKNGHLILGQAGSNAYNKEFIKKTISLLKDPDRLNRISHEAKEASKHQGTACLAEEWEKFLLGKLNNHE
jgi:glycosyltransferase involved in cell wall biosynthesis